MDITVHHQGTKHPICLPPNATLTDLTTQLAHTLQIPTTHQKLLIAPKPGLLKPPFENTPLANLTALDSPKFKITVLGTRTAAIDALNAEGESTRQKAQAREASRAEASRKLARGSRAGGTGGIHTLADQKDSYTFHKLEPLPYLPYPSRSLDFLKRLRDDPGIRATMATHKFSVPLLTEMNPVEHTTQEGRTLGLNRNRGQVIELRLRTDAYDGYRDYRTIRKTLCHELAHCVHGDHDRAFWDLTGRIEKEVERADWTSGGRSLGGEFYNPADWEASSSSSPGNDFVDEGGWTGGSFVLGGSGGSTPAGSTSTGTGTGTGSGSGSGSSSGAAGDDRREKMAKAAEERMKKP